MSSTVVLTEQHTFGLHTLQGLDRNPCGSKMTAAVMGREKVVLGNLVNNNNVKGRIAQFSKNGDGWKPPQTFAVGFWANREKSGSTLTLYEDIVSSESEDEDGGKQVSNRLPIYQSQPNFSTRTSAFDYRGSYRPATDRGFANNKTVSNRTHNKPPENKSVNKMQYCQEWLKPQHVQPIIGNVGSKGYSRFQTTSKWDARSKISQPASTTRASSAIGVYNSIHQQQGHSSLDQINLRKNTASCPPANLHSPESLYENVRPLSQQSNSSTESSSHSQTGGRSSRPTSLGSRPVTPSNELRGPLVSSRNIPASPSSNCKNVMRASLSNPMPTSTNIVLSSKHSVVSPFSTAVPEKTGTYSHLPSKPTAGQSRLSSKPTTREPMYPECRVERSTSTVQLYPVQRSSSADSIQFDRSSDKSTSYTSEVQISVQPGIHKRNNGTPPIPAPRRVKRTKSSASSTRPQSLSLLSPADDEMSRFRRPSGPHEYKQKFTSFTGEDEPDCAMTSAQCDTEITDVSLFNVNEAAILDSKNKVSFSPFKDNNNTQSRNMRNFKFHQSSLSSASQPETHSKAYPPEIIPRNAASSEHNKINKSDINSSSVSADSVMESRARDNGSPIYDNLIQYSHCTDDLSAVNNKHSINSPAPLSLSPPILTQHQTSDNKSSWDSIGSLTPIEFQTQCAQVCFLFISPKLMFLSLI